MQSRSRATRYPQPSALLSSQALAPRDFGNALHPARRLHDLLQVREVLDLHEHGAGDLPVATPEVHALDVRARTTHGGGDIRIQATAIIPFEGEPHEETLSLRFLPVDLQATLRLVREQQ